jgi:DHA1 family multidrug/chloramphenicol efflux transport protein-like MFS transporter
MSSEVSKGTVAATVSIILMLSFFVVIEAVRMAYEAYDIWAYCAASLILIALWFTLPRMQLKQLMLERQERGEF